ncbi:hypothetical protein CLOM_g2656 [Closterium sp. NIES-68]|nr:hypothetical protein CLOM_g2656 [Closterium sp. NIES-68]GJP67534.1 hypothetical protein CLOP_g24345 [Closterium sp. NIES-67]
MLALAGIGVALAIVSCCYMADNYLVISHPALCDGVSNATLCSQEFRAARRQLSVLPQATDKVTAAMVSAVALQVHAIIAAAAEIKRANVRQNHFINVVADDCGTQGGIALRYLDRTIDAINDETGQHDRAFWLSAASTQVDNCVDGFKSLAPSATFQPAFVHLEAVANKASDTLEAVVAIAKKAATAPATNNGRMLASSESTAGEGSAKWLDDDFVAQLRQLQAELNALGDGVHDYVARRQLNHKNKKAKKSNNSGSSSSGNSSGSVSKSKSKKSKSKNKKGKKNKNSSSGSSSSGSGSGGSKSKKNKKGSGSSKSKSKKNKKGSGSSNSGSNKSKSKNKKNKDSGSSNSGGSNSGSGSSSTSKSKNKNKSKSGKSKGSKGSSGKTSSGAIVFSKGLRADAVVKGSIQDAIDAAPGGGRYVIYVPAGTYKEQVVIDTPDIILIGAGAGSTVVTYDESYGSGSSTFDSATVGVNSDRFVVFGMKFVNTAGPDNHQAVAFRASGDQSAAIDCSFEGAQDTLYVDAGRQYYTNCYIGGTQDFIFGDAAVVIENAKIQLHPSKSFITLTASGRAKDTPTGIVIRDSAVSADSGAAKAFLGRPWKKCAFTVFVNTVLPAIIQPDGWLSWNEGSCMFLAESGSKGPGAKSSRASWVDPGIISSASQYTASSFAEVNSWLTLA